MSNSLRPYGLHPASLLYPWDFPGNSTGMCCHCLLHLTSIYGQMHRIFRLWYLMNQQKPRLEPNFPTTHCHDSTMPGWKAHMSLLCSLSPPPPPYHSLMTHLVISQMSHSTEGWDSDGFLPCIIDNSITQKTERETRGTAFPQLVLINCQPWMMEYMW